MSRYKSKTSSKRIKIAVFGTEPVTGKLGGLGIRQLELSRVLAKSFQVRLLTPFPVTDHREPFTIETINYEHPETLTSHIHWSDAVYSTHSAVAAVAREYGKPVAVDRLVHEYFEDLEHLPISEMDPVGRNVYFSDSISRVANQLALGDFFIAPSERSRDYYLGMLTLLGKLIPEDYPGDPHFKSLIDVVPFGLPSRRPRTGRKLLREKIPAIGNRDFLIIWGGSLANWFDCMTPVKAMARLKNKCPQAKLVFVGNTHPVRSQQPEAFRQVSDYARRQGLLDKTVFFFTDWVPFDQRDYYLTDADAGIVTFRDHVENRFSQRIRMLDYLWGELPVLTNPGNVLSDMVDKERLGVVFPFGNDRILADEMERLARRPALRKQIKLRIKKVKKRLTWDKVAQPLIDFFIRPKRTRSIYIGGRLPTIEGMLERDSVETAAMVHHFPAHPYLRLPMARKMLSEGKAREAAEMLQEHIRTFGDGLLNPVFRNSLLGGPAWFTCEEMEGLLPMNRFVPYMKVRRVLDAGRTDEASSLLEEEARRFGERPETDLCHGFIEQARGNIEEAAQRFETAWSASSGYFPYALPLAEALATLKQSERSRKLFVEIRNRADHYGEAWIRARSSVGIARLDAERGVPEYETLVKYLEVDLRNEGLAYAHASALERAGKLEEACDAFEQCSQWFADTKMKAGALFRLARLLRPENREPALKSCLALDPTHGGAQKMLAEQH